MSRAKPRSACGYCRNASGKRCRRHGRPMPKGPGTGVPHCPWTPAEDLLMERMLAAGAGHAAIVEELRRELGSVRTIEASYLRASNKGLRRVRRVYSQTQLKHLFGVCHFTVRAWLRDGVLEGTRILPTHGVTRGPRGEWAISRAQLEAFIRKQQWAYDLDRLRTYCSDRTLVSMAEVAHRADPWLRLEAAAAAVHVVRETLTKYMQSGIVPHRRRMAGRGSAKIVIRAKDIPEIAERIDQAVDQRRRQTLALRESRRQAGLNYQAQRGLRERKAA